MVSEWVNINSLDTNRQQTYNKWGKLNEYSAIHHIHIE